MCMLEKLLLWDNNEHPVPGESASHLGVPQKCQHHKPSVNLKNPLSQRGNGNILDTISFV